MYFKVALLTISIFALSACSSSLKPKPKGPNAKNLGVEVVEVLPVGEPEVIRSVPAVTTTTTQRKPKVKKPKIRKPKVAKPTSTTKVPPRVVKTKPKKTYLKPEPFSLESGKSDPELLGPQTTLDAPLSKEETPTEVEESPSTN